jgi:hypothetical protein
MASRVDQIITEVKRLGSRVDSSYDSRILESVNRSQAHWAEKLPWPGLERIETFLTPGGRDIIFPRRVQHIISIGDLKLNCHVAAGEHFEQRFDAVHYNRTPGQPFEWRDGGLSPVAAQPATDTRITVTASQSEAMSVFVRGLVRDSESSGTNVELYTVEETLSIVDNSGTTSANTYQEILTIEKPHNTTNGITARDPTGSKIIARIQPWQDTARYRKASFVFPPEANRSMEVRYYTFPQPLVKTNQSIDPAISKDYLVWRALADLHWMHGEQEASQVALARAEEIISAKIQARRHFGEKDITAIPDNSFLNFTDWEIWPSS